MQSLPLGRPLLSVVGLCDDESGLPVISDWFCFLWLVLLSMVLSFLWLCYLIGCSQADDAMGKQQGDDDEEEEEMDNDDGDATSASQK